MSAPLFTEDSYSTSTDDDQEACDKEIDRITRQRTLSQTTTMVMSPQRSDSTSTIDYSTQGDPDKTALAAPASKMYMQDITTMQNSNNYLIPDGSNRQIHDLANKKFHAGILENEHNAYLVKLPDLKPMLRTNRYLMDEITSQFYAIYGNSYQHRNMIPRLLQTCEPGQIIYELTATQHAFGIM